MSDVWDRTLDILQGQMTRATFDTWLRGSRLLEENGVTWTVAVRHAYALDWLNSRLMPVIERAARHVAGREVAVQFTVKAPQVPDPVPRTERLGDQHDVVVETVQEQKVSVRGDGSALVSTDFYIKLKTAFRERALAMLKGAKLSVWLSLALHVDRNGISSPGIDRIMQETGYTSRSTVCSALDDLVRLGVVEKLSSNPWGNDEYRVLGYAWFGREPAPALFELEEKSGL